MFPNMRVSRIALAYPQDLASGAEAHSGARGPSTLHPRAPRLALRGGLGRDEAHHLDVRGARRRAGARPRRGVASGHARHAGRGRPDKRLPRPLGPLPGGGRGSAIAFIEAIREPSPGFARRAPHLDPVEPLLHSLEGVTQRVRLPEELAQILDAPVQVGVAGCTGGSRIAR
jgi:hypothetical protein